MAPETWKTCLKSPYIIFLMFFFKVARLTPDKSKGLVTSILLIDNSLCKENLVVLFQTISINMSKCPKKTWVKRVKMAKKI